MSELQKRCQLVSLIANLFYAVGDVRACEAAYAKYVRLIEMVMGAESMETSNCYFLVGVFYIQH